MPTHVTESTGASVSATWEFSTGTLQVSSTGTFQVNTVAERTAGSGVTVDGVLLKDGTITFGTGVSLPITQGGTGATTVASARTALGAAGSGGNTDITSLNGLTTPLSVAQGGTSLATVTSGGLLYGNGTSALQVTAAGTSSALLSANASGVPVWTTPVEYIGVICVAPATSVTAVSDVAKFQFPFGGYVSLAVAGVSTAPTGTTFLTDIWVNSSSIFTTKISIDAGGTSSVLASVPPVIATATSAFNAWDFGRVHVDGTGGGTAGLVVTLVCVRTN